MTGPDVTGVDEYAEKAARLTEAEARKLAVSAAHKAFDAACVRDAHRCMAYGLPVSYTTVRGLLARFDRQEALLAEARAEERERIAAKRLSPAIALGERWKPGERVELVALMGRPNRPGTVARIERTYGYRESLVIAFDDGEERAINPDVMRHIARGEAT